MGTYRGIRNCRKFLVSVNATGKSLPVILAIVSIAILKIIYIFINRKIDTVYITCSRSIKGSLFDFFVIGISKTFGASIVNHLHGADFRDYFTRLAGSWKRIAGRLYGMIDISIVLTEGMKEQLRPLFPSMRLEVVPNFYSQEFERKYMKKSPPTKNLLYLSNIVKSKGIFYLLDAFVDIVRDMEDARLSIAGDFVADECMSAAEIRKEFMNALGRIEKSAPGTVQYISVIKGVEKVQLFARSDIFVLPTYHQSEAFPLSIIEAMRSGNAIITTRHNYLPEFISEKNGFLVEPKSRSALREALKALMTDDVMLSEIQAYNVAEAKRLYSYNLYRERISRILEVDA